ncbi:hypothetical protein BU15DRAFT_63590 [Melanogaster broomeanus]|nr:hypothetical protein BU15DRAFT_63590 [Melanogaster broomeanus]
MSRGPQMQASTVHSTSPATGQTHDETSQAKEVPEREEFLALRVAMKDGVLPLEKPFTDQNGVLHDGIRMSKGDPVFIPILAMNRPEELWEPDAHEENLPESVSHIPGAWDHMLSFLGGARACIGYRFSLVEQTPVLNRMKAILFTLVRAFEFELAVPASEIGKKATLVQRPALRGDPTNRPQLPLLVKPYQRG